jgi:hypothetical protein
MSPQRQGVLLWEIRHTQELPWDAQQRCRELLNHLLLDLGKVCPLSARNPQMSEPSRRSLPLCRLLRFGGADQIS